MTKKFATAEVLALCALFSDEEDPKHVSSQKFADFCFKINDMGWKAEKNRNKYKFNCKTSYMLGHKEEKSIKEEEVVKEEVKPNTLEEGDKFAAANSKFSAAPELIGTTVKLFWKTNDNVEMHFYSNGCVLSIVPWNTGEHIEYAKVHIDEELLKKALANKDAGGEEEPQEEELEKSMDLDAIGVGTARGGATALSQR